MAIDFSALTRAIDAAGSVLLVCHVLPDGDTLGSALALRLRLLCMGKRVIVACQDPIPGATACLPGVSAIEPAQACDLGIAIDCADALRMGDCEGAFYACKNTAVIDHHPTNVGFTNIDIVDSSAAATGVIMTEFLAAQPLNTDIALCLYGAIASDTGNFNFKNTDGRALRAAAICIDAGVDASALTLSLFRARTDAKTRLTGLALERLQMCDRVAILYVTEDDLIKYGATQADAEGIVQYGAEIIGVEVTIFAREQGGETKLSLRSRSVNVSQICADLGGGGHANAAGCTMQCSLNDAIDTMYNAIAGILKERKDA